MSEPTTSARPSRDFGDSGGRDFSSGPPRSGGAEGRRPRGAGGGRPFRRKACRFCVAQTDRVDYKNVALLRSYLTERNKILLGKASGTCSRHQRILRRAIMRARNLALLPFTVTPF